MLLGDFGEEVVGKEILWGADVKRNMGGKTHLVKTCRTEEERVQALRVAFGLELSEEEREGIARSVALQREINGVD
jgi:hypothetical protein